MKPQIRQTGSYHGYMPSCADTTRATHRPVVSAPPCVGAALTMSEAEPKNVRFAESTGGTQHARRTALLAARWALASAAVTCILKRLPALNLHRGKTPLEASTRLVSLIHAAIASVWATRLLLARGSFWPPPRLIEGIEHDAANTPNEEALLRFSASYWLADLFFLLGFERDPLMLAHHSVPPPGLEH